MKSETANSLGFCPTETRPTALPLDGSTIVIASPPFLGQKPPAMASLARMLSGTTMA
jgi:hypothetical protein